jgi:NAD(P)H-hydrate epimerase
VILDADGINAVTLHILTEEARSAPLILTPHPGEMARLMGISTAEVQANRREVACRLAREADAVVVLKGHRTLIVAPDGRTAENPTGNPGMATGGSGDVLAGIIGALVAQGLPPYEAAVCGVYLHGAAGDMAAASHSQRGMLPTDLIEELGSLFLQFEK